MSACAREFACRSCSPITRSRSSCRFCASRISGAAYDACRLRIRVRKMKAYGSNRRCSGARAFHSSQTATKPVMYIRNRAVPMKRANVSAKRPKVSESTLGRRMICRRVSRGTSSRGPRDSRCGSRGRSRAHLLAGVLPLAGGGPIHGPHPRFVPPIRTGRSDRPGVSRQFSGSRWSSRSSTVTAPTQPAVLVDDGRRHQVVRREVAGAVLEAGGRTQRLDVGVQDVADHRRGRLAQQPLDVRDAEQPAGRRLERRPDDVHQRRQGRAQLGVADVREGVGDGRVGRQDHRLGGHHAAGRVLLVGHQPPDVLGLLGVHQLEQLLGRLGRQLGDQVGGVVGGHLLEHVGGALVVQGARGSRPGPPRAAPRGRRRAARRRGRRRSRRDASGAGRGSRSRGRRAASPRARRAGASRPGRRRAWRSPRRRATPRRASGPCGRSASSPPAARPG